MSQVLSLRKELIVGDLKEMIDNFAPWDPLLVRVLRKVKDCLKWNLADLPLLNTSRSKSGRVVLIGDASHATLPFVPPLTA